jgi:hypothetical protein
MGMMLLWQDEQFVRGAAPVGAHHKHGIILEDNSVLGGSFGLNGGARNATTRKTGKGAFLLEHFAWHEWQTH